MKQAYGTWKSPLSGQAIASGISLRDLQWNSAGDILVWWESRGKTGVLLAKTGADAPRDLTDLSLNVAGRVGYGGGAFTVGAGQVYFVANGRLYKQALAGGAARAITPAFGSCAAPALSADGNWLVYAHSYENVDGLLFVDSDGANLPRKLAYGCDFVMQPVWHPAGDKIAYVAWNHPQMPWTGSELRLIRLATGADGSPYADEIVTLTGDQETAIFQPQFSPDGRYLAYVSDATGWGQLYLYDLAAGSHRQLTERVAEHGTPAWAQGLRMYGWSGGSRSLLYLENDRGYFSLRKYDLETRQDSLITGLEQYTHMEQLATAPDSDSASVAVIASSSSVPARIVSLDVSLHGSLDVSHEEARATIQRRSQTENLPASQLSPAQRITWAGDDGADVHGLFYEPLAPENTPTGKPTSLPPLIVSVHGGPTSQRTAAYYSDVQFFTTRGYAVLQVNHRGSTGYGKAYMDMHRGNWGVYDVIDSISGVKHLAQAGKIDRSKTVIMGGSAGGFTVLQSLVEHPGFYKAGISSYGVSNQFGLLMDTHKFEERYTYWLLGELPEAADLYRQRSPLFHADKIVDPLLVFQGTDDVVVPQDQSDLIVASLQRRGIPHEYHLYQGEGHGWRKPETIEAYYSAIERFLLQHVIYA